MIIILMGVCGSGKSTVGRKLSEILNFKFIEGDSFHSDENIKKMSSGSPLTESDREPWLKTIRNEIDKNLSNDKNSVITCSALSKKSREILGIERCEVKLIYLHAKYSVLAGRLGRRKNHFMPSGLLESQFKALEEPGEKEAIHVDVDRNVSEIIEQIIKEI